MFLGILVVLNLLAITSNGAKILSVLPCSSKSHFIYPNALMVELAAGGHEVTVMSPFPMENPPPNYKSIDISEMRETFEGKSNELFAEEKMQMNLISKFKFLYANTLHMTNSTLRHPAMEKLMQSNEKFDLIILDLFLTDALLGLSTVFECPIVALSANGPHTWVNDIMGSPRPASFVPHMYTGFTDRINLGKRLENEFFYFLETILLKLYHLPIQEQLFNEVFKNSNKSFYDVRKNSVAIALVNEHFSMSFPKPFLPNVIQVAGMQINEAVLKPLPDDIKKFIENSKDGVIYFSLGGNVNVSMIDEEKKRVIVSVLSRLKENIIWKYDGEDVQVDSSKFLVRKWLPQNEILAHNNTKVFVTHAGFLSCTEAVYFAKPILAIPIFGDQHRNAKKFTNRNYGIHLDYYKITEESLTWAVNEILSNPKYAESIQEGSRGFRDKPLTALETGKFWIEYVLRNRENISYVRYASLQMNFIELHNLDVYVIILIIMLLLLSIPFYGLKKLIASFKKLVADKSSKTKTK